MNKSLKISVLFILLLCLSNTSGFAQYGKHLRRDFDKKEMREKIESKKIAFLTDKLNLSPEEAQKFWPLYNQNTKNKYEDKDGFRKLMKSIKRADEGQTDRYYENLSDSLMKMRKLQFDREQKFYMDLKKILPAKKIFMLFRAEKEFHRVLLHELRGRKGGHSH
ncbi:MAG: hypothetical protein N4A49_14755 [Marinifilaceae bacterium]|jgi:hypothetical protein|nr:hypothetical protein [Marinifilaceae bacterium]